MRATLLLLTSLVLVVGCAREDRWVLGDNSAAAKQERAQNAVDREKPGTPVALHSIKVVQRNGLCYIGNPDPKRNILVTLVVSPSSTSPGITAKQQQVLVPAGSETFAGVLSDPSGLTWKYTLLKAVYQ